MLEYLWYFLCWLSGKRLIRSPLTQPNDSESITIEIPGYRQLEYFSCGYVVGMMVVHMYYPEFSEDEFYDIIDPSPDWGVTSKQLRRALAIAGVPGFTQQGLEFEEICMAITRGHPILTTMKRAGGGGHWVVIYGIGCNPDRVFVSGNEIPVVGKLLRSHEMTWAEFKKNWDRASWGIIC